jgi:hypothetical protein
MYDRIFAIEVDLSIKIIPIKVDQYSRALARSENRYIDKKESI